MSNQKQIPSESQRVFDTVNTAINHGQLVPDRGREVFAAWQSKPTLSVAYNEAIALSDVWRKAAR
jgi:hypothetical protein